MLTTEPDREFSRTAQAITQTVTELLRPGQEVDRLARGSSVGPLIQVPEPTTHSPAMIEDNLEVFAAGQVPLHLVVTIERQPAGLVVLPSGCHLRLHGVCTCLGQNSYATLAVGCWLLAIG